MPKKTRAERIAALKAELHALAMKNRGIGHYDSDRESHRHETHRLTAHHDKLTADQKKMNELEAKIRKLEGSSGGTRRTRGLRRTRGTRRRHH
jgi:small-conductance mechanosensitive channel